MVKPYVQDFALGLWSLLSGMGVTLRHFLRPKVTLEYPREQKEMSKAYRSCIEFVRFEVSGSHDCIACNQCAKVCPSFCIELDGAKPEGVRRKRATKFEVDFALCSLCGLCIDVCPTDTLKFSKKFDEVSFERKDFVHDLLVDFQAGEAAYLERAREEERRKDAEKAERAKAAAEAKAAQAANAGPPSRNEEDPKTGERQKDS